MPNLKDIKNRIQSVKNTQKITRAMKMVAAVKVKKAESTVKLGRPFSQELTSVFKRMLSVIENVSSDGEKFERAIDNYPELLSTREVKTVGLLVFTSNKGLAGAFNANIVRATLKKIKEYEEKGINVALYIVGQKGVSSLQHKDGVVIKNKYLSAAENPTPSSASVVADDMAVDYVNGEIDKIEIITTRFNNMMSYSVQDWNVLPLEVEKEEIKTEPEALMEFIPSPKAIMQQVVPMFIRNIIYQALLESFASELASRMTAMSAASNNAEEMISTLTVSFNKERQAAITQELIELVSGASTQKK